MGRWTDMSPRVRRWLLVAAGSANLGVTARMLPAERAMRAAAGHGTLAFEVAGTPERVRRLLDAWGPTGRAAARRSLRWDYGYLTTYAVFLAAACAGAARRLGRRGWRAAAAAGPTVSWAPVLAGACDAVENAALLTELRRAGEDRSARPGAGLPGAGGSAPRRRGGAENGASPVVAGRHDSGRDRGRP